MDVPLLEGSNTLSLITWVLGLPGSTFTEKCQRALDKIDRRMKASHFASPEWQRLIQTKGFVEGFIRHDRDRPFDWSEENRAAA